MSEKVFHSLARKIKIKPLKHNRCFKVIDWNDSIKYKENGIIFNNIKNLRNHLKILEKNSKDEVDIVVVSGGFDPIHIGHIRYIQSAAKLAGTEGILIVIANKDSWLERKKGFAFMKESERMEVLSSIKGVDYVISWDDGTEHVSGCLEIIRPNIFANGGDRDSAENVPEYEICQKIGCKMYFGVGGDKIQSSSDLIDKSIKEGE